MAWTMTATVTEKANGKGRDELTMQLRLHYRRDDPIIIPRSRGFRAHTRLYNVYNVRMHRLFPRQGAMKRKREGKKKKKGGERKRRVE
jgi:hypothetical protein